MPGKKEVLLNFFHGCVCENFGERSKFFLQGEGLNFFGGGVAVPALYFPEIQTKSEPKS